MPFDRVETDQGQLRALILDFKTADEGMNGRVAKVMRQSGPTFVRTMRAHVPVDTGTLKKSLHWRVNRQKIILTVGSLKRNKNPKTGMLAMKYVGYVHDGTSRVGPRPFISDAVNKHTSQQSGFMRGLRRAGIANIGRSTGGSRL